MIELIMYCVLVYIYCCVYIDMYKWNCIKYRRGFSCFTFFFVLESSRRLNKALELAKVGNTPTAAGIPALGSGEGSGATTNVGVTSGNIANTSLASLVQPGVKEAKRSLAVGDEVVVDKSKDGGGGGGSSRGTTSLSLKAAVPRRVGGV